MNSSYITPFVNSITNVFETMLQLPVQVKAPVLKQQPQPSHDVTGIIGMSGDVEGTVILAFPTAVAERTVTVFTGEEISSDHEDFADAIGELANMVSGGAKAQFQGKNVSITTPSVVIGSDHKVHGRKDFVCVLIPCECDLGEFCLEVSIKNTGPAPAETAAAVNTV